MTAHTVQSLPRNTSSSHNKNIHTVPTQQTHVRVCMHTYTEQQTAVQTAQPAQQQDQRIICLPACLPVYIAHIRTSYAHTTHYIFTLLNIFRSCEWKTHTYHSVQSHSYACVCAELTERCVSVDIRCAVCVCRSLDRGDVIISSLFINLCIHSIPRYSSSGASSDG